MNHIVLVMKSSIKDHLRSRIAVLICVAVVLICAVGLAAIFITQVLVPAVNAAIPVLSTIESYFSLILYTTCIVTIGIWANVFAFQSMTREKSRGNIQALLVTPLAPNEIWLGKSLAVFLPGLVFAWLMTLAAFLIVNYVYLLPEVGFIINPWIIVNNFIGVPLLYLVLNLLVHIVGLMGKPATGNVISQVFLPILIAGIINLVVRNVFNAGSWVFTVTLVGLSLILWVIILSVRSKLTVERIILSQ